MATNRTLQQKRRAGCLKGGSAAVPSAEESLVPPQAAQYATALVSGGLKIRLMRRDSQSQSQSLHSEHDNFSDAAAAHAPAMWPTISPESDSEELLEEGGDDDDDHDPTAHAAGTSAKSDPAAPTCVVDLAGARIIATVGCVAGGVVIGRVEYLTAIGTVPLEAAACNGDGEADDVIMTLRGLALADLVDRLYDRRVAILAEATYDLGDEGDDDDDSDDSGDDEGEAVASPSPLLLLPATRLPWPSLAVRRPPPPAKHPPPALTPTPLPEPPARPLPDWWREWDGPLCAVSLNSLRRSDAFMRQFSDESPG